MKRETGYYWVKHKQNDAWQTAFYSATTLLWSPISVSLAPFSSVDNFFFKINETRISTPEETETYRKSVLEAYNSEPNFKPKE